MRRLFVAGNWKMNLTAKSADSLASGLAAEIPAEIPQVEVAVCPPFPYLTSVQAVLRGTGIHLGAQNAYFEEPGAFTGEVAPAMLVDVGCKYAILGHSERRQLMGETSAIVSRKTAACLKHGLDVILCVGELLEERQSNRTEAILDEQLGGSLAGIDAGAMSHIVIAYEPVWAIGTGVTASPEQAEAAHAYIRNWAGKRYNSQIAENLRILYGGSVKPDNAQTLMQQPNVDGALVGGASLKVEQFLPIVRAAQQVG
jgi:triosephosphate isomerase